MNKPQPPETITLRQFVDELGNWHPSEAKYIRSDLAEIIIRTDSVEITEAKPDSDGVIRPRSVAEDPDAG